MPRVVSDSSTLIHLSAIGRLALLRELFDELTIPPAVWREVVEQGKGRAGVEDVETARQVLEKALEFDEHDRAEVGEALLESLEVEDPEEEAAFVAEIEHRAAEMEYGAVKSIPWEELWAELQRERGGS
jgi:hypothetical protein